MNSLIEQRISERIHELSGANKGVLSQRIDELDREWDLDRAAMAAVPCAAGVVLALGLLKDRKWFGLLAAQLSILALHAVTGWSPPAVGLRKLGFRSRPEIDAEKYAVKALRGDFTMKGRASGPDRSITKAWGGYP